MTFIFFSSFLSTAEELQVDDLHRHVLKSPAALFMVSIEQWFLNGISYF